jgi:hypothetical protein
MNKGSLMALALGLSLFGCQSSYKFQENEAFQAYQKEVNEWTGLEKVGIYFKDRFLDAMDIVTFDISVGDGFLATAHATKWLEIGAGYFNGLRYGMLRRSFGTWYDDRTEGGLAIGFNLYWEDVKRTPMWGTSTLFDQEFAYEGPDYLDNRDRHWSDIGGTFHLAFLGTTINFSPFQAVDFVVGIFALPTIYPTVFGPEMDPADDDTRARLRVKYGLPYYQYTLEQEIQVPKMAAKGH